MFSAHTKFALKLFSMAMCSYVFVSYASNLMFALFAAHKMFHLFIKILSNSAGSLYITYICICIGEMNSHNLIRDQTCTHNLNGSIFVREYNFNILFCFPTLYTTRIQYLLVVITQLIFERKKICLFCRRFLICCQCTGVLSNEVCVQHLEQFFVEKSHRNNTYQKKRRKLPQRVSLM